MYSMNYIGKFISNFRDFYNEINAATLTGAIDVVVVEQADGTFNCSPFHVRFGKLGVLRSREKVVDIEINGEPRQIHMKLGDSGEAFFVEEVHTHGLPVIPPHLACSPIPNESCFPNDRRFHLLSDLPQEQHEKILRNSVLSIEKEKWEQMSALPTEQRENFLIEQFSDLPLEQREKWLQIASLTTEERDKMFQEYYGSISTAQKEQMIREQYSALKTEDKEKLFKENFPELPAHQRQKFEKALLSDWKKKKSEVGENNEEDEDEDEDEQDCNCQKKDDEIFDMDGINEEEPKVKVGVSQNPKSFIALPVTERSRKISVVKNDFRPITSESEVPSSKDTTNESIKNGNGKETAIDESRSGTSSKRKRKRKSVIKKKGSQRKSSNGSSGGQTQESDPPLTADEAECQSTNMATSMNADFPSEENSNESTDRIETQRTPTDLHFFSDTEVTKNRDASRPSSPVQSDTEFEVRKITREDPGMGEEQTPQQSWRWGELPSPPPESAHASHRNSMSTTVATSSAHSNETEARRSMLSGMFSFMKKTSRVRHNPESEGIYLCDLDVDELDPEVAALYFPSSHRGRPATMVKEKLEDQQDTESGHGPSLPPSPNSVEGAIGGPKSLDSDFEEAPKQSPFDNIDISLSMCGGLDSEQGPSDEAFHQSLINFEDLCADPKLYENPNLVVRINGRLYNWATACPIVMTCAAFQRQPPENVVANWCLQHSIHDEKKQSAGLKAQGPSSGYSSWFSWRRSSSQTPKKAQETAQAVGQSNAEQGVEIKEEVTNVHEAPSTVTKEETSGINLNNDTVDAATEPVTGTEVNETQTQASFALGQDQNHLQATKALSAEREGYSGGEDSDGTQDRTNRGVKIPIEQRPYYEPSTDKYRKTLRLTSEQIASLNLKEGPNEVVFSVTTAYQGTTRCKCHIYRWRWDDKVVISDIDGTITKSDVLGHILPIVGKDWAQSGVAQLFTKIKNNGYKLLYLSARAIGQARVTREYLKSIRQGDLSLPEGPLLLNPTSLISAFHREVIEKKPEEFKISCLTDIAALFPADSKPFYAGYGNRINDVWAYRAVGIPIVRIFTINHRGELKHEVTQTFQSSYSGMSYLVDHVFPAIREHAADEFSNFSYWREPIIQLTNLVESPTATQAT